MKHLYNRGTYLLTGMFVLLTFLTGCLVPDSGSDSGTVVDIVPPEAAPDPNSYVCNPMDGEVVNQPRTQGVRGTLYYLTSTQLANGVPREQVSDFFNYGHLVTEAVLYFNQIYVPTRRFDLGFVTHSGQTITMEGNTGYEYFAVRHEARLQLGTKPPGLYQMAVISDDGAIYSMDFTGSGYNTVVDNDGTHPTRMGCATAPIALESDDKVPFLLDYFQGPKYHISVILMWRPWPMSTLDPSQPASAAEAQDAFCGVEGNSLFFDYNYEPSTPTANYHALLARGWEPVAPENFSLPEASETNPCNEPAPAISDFRVFAITTTSITVNWTTDRPATSQVIYRKTTDANPSITDLDGEMRTSHSVTVTGLVPNSDYELQATSASSSGLSSDSVTITVRTRR